MAVAIANQSVIFDDEYHFDFTQNGTTFSDADGDALTYLVSIALDNSGLTRSGTDISGTIATTEQINISISASDPSGSSVSESCAINVTEINSPPIISMPIADKAAVVGEEFSFEVTQNGQTFTDPDGDNLTYSISLSSNNVGLSVTDTTITGTPSTAMLVTVDVTAIDPKQLTVTEFFTIAISEPPSNTEQKNILFIIADDMGQDSSSQYNYSTDLPATPTLDELANQGIVFENLWVNPICSPTRSAIISGKYGVTTNVLAPGDELEASELTIQESLKANPSTANYTTAMIGKWHLGGDNNRPNDSGIDYFAGLLGGGVQDYYDWTITINGEDSARTNYTTTEFTDQAINWVNEQNQPWFLWLSYNAPHTPFHLPPENLHSRNLSGEASDIDNNPRQYYLAAIEAMDSEIGRLLSSMSESERDNTVIIFIGDNGTPGRARDNSATIQGTKGDIYEGGMRVPMIVAGANVSRIGQRECAIINGTDFYTTILALAGQDVVPTHDSESFAQLLTEKNTGTRDYIFTQNEENYALRSQRYKLIQGLDDTRELYDLNQDVAEANNIIDQSASIASDFQQLETAMSRIVNDGWIVNKFDNRSPYLMEGGEFVEVNVLNVEDDGTSMSVNAKAVPNYRVVVTEELLTVYQSRPESAFRNGQTLSLGQEIEWGEDVGLTANCGATGADGWWPKTGSACPEAQTDMTLQFPKNPTPAINECETGLGPVGLWVNGVPIYNWSDASSYNNEGVWANYAVPFRSAAMDVCNGHAGNGMYHHHSYNTCLKQQLGDKGIDTHQYMAMLVMATQYMAHITAKIL